MKLTYLFTAVLASSSALASPLAAVHVKRDAAAVVDAVNTIGTSLVTLNTTVTGYSGGLGSELTALKIELESSQLVRDLKDAISTTQQSANFTDAESGTVATALVTLEPQILSALTNIASKKAAFEKGILDFISLTFLVKNNLQQQKDLSAQLGDAVTAKLTPNYASLAPLITGQIADAFTAAINTFD